MRSLRMLQSTPTGRRLLEQEMTFEDPAVFLKHLRLPQKPAKTGPAGSLPVYAHQQVYLDYRASVVAKIIALRNLSPDVLPEFIWIDTDRAGSEKLSLRIYLRGGIPVRIAPAGCEKIEPRFIQMEPARLEEAATHIAAVLRTLSTGSDRLARFEKLRFEGKTLAEFSQKLTGVLLNETMAFQPRPVLVSDLVAGGELRVGIEIILQRRQEFIAVVNERIATLKSLEIDPQIKPLPQDYLPLFMTSPVDGARLRLRFRTDGDVCLASATNSLGDEDTAELGRSGNLTMEHLDREVRWSPDVTLPVLVNHRYSGMVAGKSSALYMLVFREAIRKVMDMTPIPVLVPSVWDVFPGAFDSLFDAYLDGRTV